MSNYRPLFFYNHLSLYVKDNLFYESDPHYEDLKFLLLIMQIIYLFNMQWLLASLGPHQSQLIKDLTMICGGTLVFITITLRHLWRSEKSYCPHLDN